MVSAMFAKGLRFLPSSVRKAMKLFTSLSKSPTPSFHMSLVLIESQGLLKKYISWNVPLIPGLMASRLPEVTQR